MDDTIQEEGVEGEQKVEEEVQEVEKEVIDKKMTEHVLVRKRMQKGFCTILTVFLTLAIPRIFYIGIIIECVIIRYPTRAANYVSSTVILACDHQS